MYCGEHTFDDKWHDKPVTTAVPRKEELTVAQHSAEERAAAEAAVEAAEKFDNPIVVAGDEYPLMGKYT